MKYTVQAVAFVVVLGPAAATFGQGKLQQVREAVDSPGKPWDDSPSNPNTDASTPEADDSWKPRLFGESAWPIIGYTLISPWGIPHTIFDAGLPVTGRFPRHPFASPDARYMAIDRSTPVDDPNPSPFDLRTDLRDWTIRTSAEVGSDFGGLNRVGLRGVFDTTSRFGVKADWDYFSERLPCGCRDDLWIGDITATFRFVQTESLMMHTGLGLRLGIDVDRTDAGFNFLYSVDLFPAKPLHASASFEAGTLGNASVVRGHFALGASWRKIEIFGGYDIICIGTVNLQGPMIGLRLWY